jgi:hypothetical protein
MWYLTSFWPSTLQMAAAVGQSRTCQISERFPFLAWIQLTGWRYFKSTSALDMRSRTSWGRGGGASRQCTGSRCDMGARPFVTPRQISFWWTFSPGLAPCGVLLFPSIKTLLKGTHFGSFVGGSPAIYVTRVKSGVRRCFPEMLPNVAEENNFMCSCQRELL